jgi:Na+-transporting methylmalonyl-CoA/oxaloacetate decarboxylase gamma subunit
MGIMGNAKVLAILLILVTTTWSFSIFKDSASDKIDAAKDSSSNEIRKQLNSIKVDKQPHGFSPSQIKCKLKN